MKINISRVVDGMTESTLEFVRPINCSLWSGVEENDVVSEKMKVAYYICKWINYHVSSFKN